MTRMQYLARVRPLIPFVVVVAACAAIAFLGCDGLIAPNARWSCENLMIFMEHVPLDREFTVTATHSVDWIDWARKNNLLSP